MTVTRTTSFAPWAGLGAAVAARLRGPGGFYNVGNALCLGTGVALAAMALLCGIPAGGRAADGAVDVSIVTAIDISESVPPGDTRAELTALAAALRSPEFLAAARRGPHGRIRFAAFAWHNGPIDFLPWTVIGTAAEAEATARLLEARVAVDVQTEARSLTRWYAGRLTDISRALDHASDLAASAGGPDLVVNLIGSGADNVGEPAAAARDRLLARGARVNGVVVGGAREEVDYYRSEVAGGPGSFVMAVDGSAALVELMRRKLLRDLVAVLEAPR